MAFTYTTLKQAIQDYCESNESSFVNNMPTIIQQAEDKVTAFNTAGGDAIGKYGFAVGDDGFIYMFYCGPWSP